MESTQTAGGAPNTLPPALAGSRRLSEPAATGPLAWYQDEPPRPTAAIPLLLVHSINAAANAYEMKPLYDHYRRTRPVYAPDLPGFGCSARARRRYDPRLMTDAIHALVAHIQRERGPGPIDALALSLSSEFLARAAVEAPGAFRSIALVSPTGFNRKALREGPAGSTRGLPALLGFLARPAVGPRVFGWLTRRRVIAYFLRRTWGSKRIDAGLLDYDYLSSHVPGAEHAPLHFLTGFLFSGDSGRLYRSLTAPVWVVHGVRGDFVDYRGLGNVAGRPNWSIEVLPTGALPHFELPEEFIARYDRWAAAARPVDRPPPASAPAATAG
jgi:pimeloyl-ACP methyl ester carboxylesterase